MKFPYELSQDRLLLLSKEDRELYEYEHSPFYSFTEKENAYKQFYEAQQYQYNYYQNMLNDSEFNDMNEDEKSNVVKELAKAEALESYNIIEKWMNPILSESLSKKDIDILNDHMRHIIIESYDKPGVLNEEVGHDATFWMNDLGWLGKLAGGLFGTGIAAIIGAFVAGKDAVAAKMLERFMNKLVELTDDGVHKKKSWFSWFSKKKRKYSGDQSESCFRSYQEMIQRDLMKDTIVGLKTCGFIETMNDYVSNNYNGGLYTEFYPKVVEGLEEFIQK